MERLGKNCARAPPILGIGGDQRLFRLLNVGPAFQQLGANAGGQILRRRRERIRSSMRDRSGISAQQQVQSIFLLLNLFFRLRYFRGRGVDVLFGLKYIRKGNGATALKCLGEIDGILAHLHGLLGDLQLPVKRLKLLVGCGNLQYECQANSALRPALREELGSGSFGLFAIEAPEVRRPRGAEVEAAFDQWIWDAASEAARQSGADDCSSNGDCWKFLRSNDLDLGLLFKHSLSGMRTS